MWRVSLSVRKLCAGTLCYEYWYELLSWGVYSNEGSPQGRPLVVKQLNVVDRPFLVSS